MTVAINDIIDDAEIILNDTTNVRWAATELLAWANAAQIEIIKLVPHANTLYASVLLTSGTKQTLASGSIRLIDIIRNMGLTPGTTAGNAITMVTKGHLDKMFPDWHTTTASTTVKHFMYDPATPKIFWVYPQSPGTNYVDIITSVVPTAMTAGTNIDLDDEYRSAILDYILYRGYQKDADFNPEDKRVIGHWQAFMGGLGVSG